MSSRSQRHEIGSNSQEQPHSPRFQFYCLNRNVTKGLPILYELTDYSDKLFKNNKGTFGVDGLENSGNDHVTEDNALIAAASTYGGLLYDYANDKYEFRYQSDSGLRIISISTPSDIDKVLDLLGIDTPKDTAPSVMEITLLSIIFSNPMTNFIRYLGRLRRSF